MESFGNRCYHHFTPLPWIELWIEKNVKRPIKGFESKRNVDGSYYSFAQQMRATRRQVLAVGMYFFEQGKTHDEIRVVLAHFR